MCLMRRQHRWSPVFSQHVFQDFISTFASSEAKRWEWVHESLQSPSIAEGGSAAESQGCALDTVAFRGHRGSTSGQARLETSRHSDPEMQPMKTRYDTIANLHLYGYTVTQYQHRDRQVCKSKTWAPKGKETEEKMERERTVLAEWEAIRKLPQMDMQVLRWNLITVFTFPLLNNVPD